MTYLSIVLQALKFLNWLVNWLENQRAKQEGREEVQKELQKEKEVRDAELDKIRKTSADSSIDDVRERMRKRTID